MIECIDFLETPYDLQLESRNWRNQENVARYFKIKHIDEPTHINWLESLKKEEPKNIAFFIKYNNEFVGVTYFHSINYEKKQADWGIYLNQENIRGKGIGKQALNKCIEYAKENLGLKTLYLDVMKSNKPAIKIYEASGFEFVEKEEEVFLRYKKELF